MILKAKKQNLKIEIKHFVLNTKRAEVFSTDS